MFNNVVGEEDCLKYFRDLILCCFARTNKVSLLSLFGLNCRLYVIKITQVSC